VAEQSPPTKPGTQRWYGQSYRIGPVGDPRLGAAYRLYTVLLTYADDRLTCYPSLARLAADLNVTRNAVVKMRDVLIRYGYLTQYGRLDRGTSGLHGQARTHYRLSPPDVNLAPVDARAAGCRGVHPRCTAQAESGAGSTKAAVHPSGTEVYTQDGTVVYTPGGQAVHPGLPKLTQVTNPVEPPQVTNPPAAQPPVPVAAKPTQPEHPGKPDEVAKVWAYYRARIQPKARECPTSLIRARLKTFTLVELQRGMDHFAADAWSMEHNGWRGGKWYFASNDRVEGFLNMPPRRAEGATADGRRDGGAQRPPAAANRWVAASNAAGWITDDTNPFEAYRETTLGASRP
jgi:hypothetical protein